MKWLFDIPTEIRTTVFKKGRAVWRGNQLPQKALLGEVLKTENGLLNLKMFEVLSTHEQQVNNDFTILSIALKMRSSLSSSYYLQIPLCRFLS